MKENFGNLKCEEALKSLLGCLISSKLRSIINYGVNVFWKLKITGRKIFLKDELESQQTLRPPQP